MMCGAVHGLDPTHGYRPVPFICPMDQPPMAHLPTLANHCTLYSNLQSPVPMEAPEWLILPLDALHLHHSPV